MKLTKETKTKRKLFAPKKKFTCPNCQTVLEEGDGHFVPPAFGDKGFFICKPAASVEVIDKNFWELLA